MNPRILLATLFGGARASAHGGQLLSRKELHALAGTVQAWAGHLLLPALTPEQRMQMSRGDLPGLAGLALTLRDLLLTLPDLQAALEMTVQVFDALRHKGLELLTISERARDIGDEAAAGQAAVLEHLQRTCDEITGAAERLRDEASTPAAERGLLSACLDGVDWHEERRDDKKDARKARARRVLAPLQAEIAQGEERRTALQLQAALLSAAGAEGEAPQSALTIGTAPQRERPLATPRRAPGPRRGGPEAGTLQEPAGAPLERCLDAPLEQFVACAAQLQDLRDKVRAMGLSPQQPRSADSLEALELGDRALLLAEALGTSPRLRQACGVSPERIEGLYALCGALGMVQDAAQRLLRGAQDGWLAFANLVILCCDGAQRWGAAKLRDGGLGEAERGALQIELDALREALRRASEPARREHARLQQRAASLSREIEAADAEEQAAAVVDRIRAGEAVPVAELQAAAAVQQRKPRRIAALRSAAVPAAAKGRSRRR